VRPQVRPLDDRDAEAVVGLSLRAWAPVFASIEQAIGSEIFGNLYPEDWRETLRSYSHLPLALRLPLPIDVLAHAVGFYP
jgi:hypothetical protein